MSASDDFQNTKHKIDVTTDLDIYGNPAASTIIIHDAE
jgi:hypothetical protein